MLGRHPELFALPEQNLFLANTLRELLEWEEEAGTKQGYLAGLKRAVAELEFGGQGDDALGEAAVWIQRRWSWRTDRMFWWLTERVGPRVLLYKSPRTTLARSSMNRMLAAAPRARYLHLVREPAAAIADWASTVGESGVQVNRFFAELWVQCQRAMLETECSMGTGQMLRVRGEEVLNRPAESMRKIVGWLGLAADDGDLKRMEHPEDWLFAGSLPGLHDGDNDTGFLRDPKLRPASAQTMRVEELGLGRELTQEIGRLGVALGYSMEG
jgi:hypothetical protein